MSDVSIEPKDYEISAQELTALAETLGLTVTWEFVPWSKSRNSKEKDPSLNWLYVLLRNGREVIRGDYMRGMGHIPGYRSYAYKSMEGYQALLKTCETGRTYKNLYSSGVPLPRPTASDLLSSLALDSNALDSPTYEDWAGEYGYEVDSRKGEAIYRQCLEIALKLRNAVGDDNMSKMRDLANRL